MFSAKRLVAALIIIVAFVPAGVKWSELYARNSVSNITPLAARIITHPTRGFEDCQSCHATGTNGAVKNPDNHSAYTNKDCNICHKLQ